MSKIIMRLPPRDAINYPIFIDTHLLNRPHEWLPDYERHRKLIIITDDEVKKHYSQTLIRSLAKLNPLLLSFPSGEQSKNYQTKQRLEEQMLKYKCDRETIILALGGGVVGDIAGFIASTYMRGVSYIQMPTTLLAMVDSSVGGKTGINNAFGKNIIGSFWNPSIVVADLNCLNTLSEKQLVNGLIEIIKILITNDKETFNNIAKIIDGVLARDMNILKDIIHCAVKLKVSIVSQDENESNLRKILNFGHTIGHAIETISGYSLLHGYAVAYGILVESKISQLLGILSSDDFFRIKETLQSLNITGCGIREYNIEDIIQATKSDKKNQSDQVQYILVKTPGEVYTNGHQLTHAVSDEVVREALNIVSELNYGR